MQPSNARAAFKRLTTQTGVAAVEFSLVAIIFFTFVFGIIELARAFYICNTLQEVTRSAAAAAAMTDFSNPAALDSIRRQSIFRNSAGALAGAPDITDEHVRIDYLSITRSANSLTMEPTSALPANPAKNRIECLKDPNSTSCIRLVRVRICDPKNSSSCQPVPFHVFVPLISLNLNLPTSTTIKVAESLGFVAGMTP